jgi:uncharacterized protein
MRGFALLGVLIVNLRDFSLYSLMSAAQRDALPTATVDRLLSAFLSLLVDTKAATLFAMLFGVGFALQMQRLARHEGGVSRYPRRLLILLIIGLAHAYLLWWGDILRYYAVLGLALLPFARMPAWCMAVLGVAVALFAWPLLLPFMRELLPPVAPSAVAAEAAFTALMSERWADAWVGNLDYDLRMRIANWSLVFFVFGRLLVGASLGRAGVFNDLERHASFWRRLFLICLPTGMALTAFGIMRDQGIWFAEGWWKTDPARNVARVLRSGSSLVLALAYMAAFVLWFRTHAGRRVLTVFSPVGRMALTHYLGQTLLALPLFYGLGLGFGGQVGLTGLLALAAVIFVVQVALSRWWLRCYAFGPVEWIWRCLTYGRLLPLRRGGAESIDQRLSNR